MDLENQKRVKEFAEEYGPENIVVVLGAAEGEAAGLAAETVTAGDPTFAGPLTGVQLGLQVYHVCEPEMKEEFDEAVYDEQISMMEMVLDVDDIISEMTAIRDNIVNSRWAGRCYPAASFLKRRKGKTHEQCDQRGKLYFSTYAGYGAVQRNDTDDGAHREPRV